MGWTKEKMHLLLFLKKIVIMGVTTIFFHYSFNFNASLPYLVFVYIFSGKNTQSKILFQYLDGNANIFLSFCGKKLKMSYFQYCNREISTETIAIQVVFIQGVN